MPNSTTPIEVGQMSAKVSGLFAIVAMAIETKDLPERIDWKLAAKRLGYKDEKSARSNFNLYKSRLFVDEKLSGTESTTNSGGKEVSKTQNGEADDKKSPKKVAPAKTKKEIKTEIKEGASGEDEAEEKKEAPSKKRKVAAEPTNPADESESKTKKQKPAAKPKKSTTAAEKSATPV